MALDSDQLVIAGTGTIYVAAVGTSAPTDIVTAFSGSWTDLGYTTEDGVTFNTARSIQSIPAWQSDYPVRRKVTSRDSSLGFVLMQWNTANLKLAFGGGAVTEPSAGVFKYVPPDADDLDERAMAVEWIDGSYTYRLIVPKGMVTDDVETNLQKTAEARLPITFGINYAGTGNPFYILTNDPEFTVG